jgi:hypothetical protein
MTILATELGAEDGHIATDDRGYGIAGEANALPVNTPTRILVRRIGSHRGES